MAPFLRALALAPLVVAAVFTTSCSFIFNLEALELGDWSPRAAFVDAPSTVSIWVEYSSVPDATKAEEAFSFSEDGSPMDGMFVWQGRRMLFQPVMPLSSGHDYRMHVETSVETEDGRSLPSDFYHDFTTRTERLRPAILSIRPEDESMVGERFAVIEVVFSEPVDRSSVVSGFSLSPDPGGSLAFSSGDRVIEYTPLSELEMGTEYTITLRDTIMDLSGNYLAETRSSRFRMGTETVRPVVVRVGNLVGGMPGGLHASAEDPGDGDLEVNSGWETDWGIIVEFSEAVERDGIEAHLTFEPAFNYSIDPEGGARAVFSLVPVSNFDWNGLYTLTVSRGVKDTNGNASAGDTFFNLLFDGPLTRPPRVERLDFRQNPAGSQPQVLSFTAADVYHNLPLPVAEFPVATTVSTYLDVFVRCAEGAGIDAFSLMNDFFVTTTNGAALFKTVWVKNRDFDDPQPASVAGLTPVRIGLDIENTTAAGLVTFVVGSDLADSRGTRAGTEFSLPLLK